MQPIASQIPVPNRAGPSPVPRGTDAVSQIAVAGQTEILPVEQIAEGEDTHSLDRDGVERSPQAESAIARRLRAQQAGAKTDPDAPQDRAVFRAKAIRLLSAAYRGNESFERALKLGTLVIQPAGDEPEQDLQPELSYALYRQGALSGAGTPVPPRAGSTVTSVGLNDFVAWWPK